MSTNGTRVRIRGKVQGVGFRPWVWQVAQQLGLSVRTVETHRLSIRRKLDIQKPADLVRHAREYGWRPEGTSNV